MGIPFIHNGNQGGKQVYNSLALSDAHTHSLASDLAMKSAWRSDKRNTVKDSTPKNFAKFLKRNQAS